MQYRHIQSNISALSGLGILKQPIPELLRNRFKPVSAWYGIFKGY